MSFSTPLLVEGIIWEAQMDGVDYVVVLCSTMTRNRYYIQLFFLATDAISAVSTIEIVEYLFGIVDLFKQQSFLMELS